jgi:hypothetical protein
VTPGTQSNTRCVAAGDREGSSNTSTHDSLFVTRALVIIIIRNKCAKKILNTLSSRAKSVSSSNNLFNVPRYVSWDVTQRIILESAHASHNGSTTDYPGFYDSSNLAHRQFQLTLSIHTILNLENITPCHP